MAGRNLFADTVVEETPIAGRNLLEVQAADDSILSEGDTESSGFLAAVEPALAIASGAVAEPAAGLAGIAQSLNPFADEGAGVEAIEGTREALSFTPTTEKGKKRLETVGDLVQSGIDLANVPLSGIGGIAELLTGQGFDQAIDTIKNIQTVGVSETAGQRTFEETGSPAAAAIAQTLPTAALSLAGVKAAPKVKPAVVAAGKAAAKVTEKGRQLAKDIFRRQSPVKQKIAKLIEEGSTDATTAKFSLVKPTAKPTAKPASRLGEFLNKGGPRVKTDPLAVETIKQGFDDGVIAAVKGASSADKSAMLEMAKIMEKGKKNKLFAQNHRPSDIAGNTLMERFKSITKANKQAGSELDGVAKSLKSQTVDTTPAITGFIDDLDSMGIKLDSKNKPIFRGSDIEGASTEALKAQSILKTAISRMSNTDIPNAFDVHRLKRFIDSQVTFGKTATGMPGGAERVLKRLRHNLDGLLDEKFPEYNRVNTVFAETRGAIDALQDAAGRKMNLGGANADKATGTLLRRLMSNAQSRVNLLDAIDEIDVMAKKYGGAITSKNDLLTQVLFVDELDAVFGPVARTSFEGLVGRGAKRGVRAATSPTGAIDLAIDAGAAVGDKVKGVNQANAFKSIKKLLESAE